MAEDRLAVQIPQLQNVMADLNSAASKLQSSKDVMDAGVRTNTQLWLDSTSPAAAAWKAADLKIGQLIQHLHSYTVAFSTTTNEVSTTMNTVETRNQNLF